MSREQPLQKPPSYTPVRTLMLYTTEDCNLRCTYCFVDKKPKRMSMETARKAVDFFLDRNISGGEYEINISFFGGEPFTELDVMEEVIRYAREPHPNTYKRVTFAATTNGTVANERVERIVRETQMHLLVSVDGGHGPSAYRPFVSGRSSYEALARNLPRLARWSPNLMARMTFHPRALDLVENVKHVFALGAPRIALCPVVEEPWQDHVEELEQAYDRLADWYIDEARQERILSLEVTNTLLRQYHKYRVTGARPFRPCGVGTSQLGIDTEGHVMPCHRFLYRPHDWLGTVDSPQLSESREKYVHLFSRDMLGCDRCMANTVCGGGCRVVALNAGLGLNEPHPSYCITTRAHARAVFRIYDTLSSEGNRAFTKMLRSTTGLHGSIAELALS